MLNIDSNGQICYNQIILKAADRFFRNPFRFLFAASVWRIKNYAAKKEA